jgi:hypothetical protein
MIKLNKCVIATLAMGVLIAGLFGCEKKEGPAEQAGKELDKVVEQAGEKIDAGVEKAGEQIEKAGEEIQDEAKDAKKY